MELKKGQIFILTAIIFTSLLFLVATSYDNIIQGKKESTFKNYFDRAKNDHVQTFNQALSENYSSEYIEKRLYNTNRFIFRRLKAKSVRYRSVNLFILPKRGDLTIINYQNSKIEPKIKLDDSWINRTVGSEQNLDYSFKDEPENLRVIISSLGIDRRFKTYTPRLLNFIEMEKSRERWRSVGLH